MMFRFDKSGKIMGVSDVQFIESYRYNGVDFYHLLNKLNASIRKKCSGSILVDLTHVRDWEETDFYDLFHNTPQGAKKVGLEIYKNIKNKRF
jgi:hypothetical protein